MMPFICSCTDPRQKVVITLGKGDSTGDTTNSCGEGGGGDERGWVAICSARPSHRLGCCAQRPQACLVVKEQHAKATRRGEFASGQWTQGLQGVCAGGWAGFLAMWPCEPDFTVLMQFARI